MTEVALTVVRQPATRKRRGKGKDSAGADPSVNTPSVRRYCQEFAKKYGENGRPSNAYVNYQPPTLRTRLRDGNGAQLRKNAEKSTELNEFLVDLFTPSCLICSQEQLQWELHASKLTVGMWARR